MQCVKPIWIKLVDMYVPCGKCDLCKAQKANEWSLRLLHELGYHDKAVFLTLTYDEEHLPADASVNVQEFQRYIKKIRKRAGDRRIVYYGSAEYGDKYGRPHYHLIVFGLSIYDFDIYDCWDKGNVFPGTVTEKSIRYTAKYILKKSYKAEFRKLGRTQPFSLMSKGIGRQYALDNFERLLRNMTEHYKGKEVGIPRYYLKMYKDIFSIPVERIKEASVERINRINELLEKYDEDVAVQKVKMDKVQRLLNLNARVAMKEGKL